MADEFILSQDAAAGSEGAEPQEAEGFDLSMDDAQVAQVDVTGDGAADGVAFDLTQDGVADSVAIDTNADGIADGAVFDLDQDGMADVVTVDSDGDGVPDVAFDLEQVAPDDAGFEEGHEPQPFTDDPGDVSEADLQQASEDLDAQTHIQSGMHDMYNSIYHDSIDSF